MTPELAAQELTTRRVHPMITLTNDPPTAATPRVDWMWNTTVHQVLDNLPDLLSWAH